MARIVDDVVLRPSRSTLYGSFPVRYPDYASWLDGSTWELEVETDLHEPVNTFRAALYYQATTVGMKLATRVRHRLDGTSYLMVRAYPADE
jgi:hypothetical protein